MELILDILVAFFACLLLGEESEEPCVHYSVLSALLSDELCIARPYPVADSGRIIDRFIACVSGHAFLILEVFQLASLDI